jgi:type IV secretory pathway VirB2 component (pilin)
MKKWLIGIMSLVWATSLISLSPVTVNAQNLDVWGNTQNSYANIGLSDTDPRDVVANVIKVVLGFLGTIAVVLIIVAGFQWMTAAGSEDKIAKAKKIMTAAVIGLVIVLMAYALSTFVIKAIISATNPTAI